jgi:hypothetical protein
MAACRKGQYHGALKAVSVAAGRRRLAGRGGSRNGHRAAGPSDQGRGHRSARCAAQPCNRRDNHGDTFPRNARRDPASRLGIVAAVAAGRPDTEAEGRHFERTRGRVIPPMRR